MRIKDLQPISAAIARHDADAACAAIENALTGETGPAWNRELRKLAAVIRDNAPRFTVFARGNSKLPFLAWSSLPGVGFCHGAGACLDFCYSFKAQRYPAAYARQAQNSWLLSSTAGRSHIARALDALEPADGLRVDFRLYVDGDFSSVSDVAFWMAAIAARPWLRAYGYSKAFRELLAYNVVRTLTWPPNYLLNMSSGHKHDADVAELTRALPIVRGDFVAVPMAGLSRHVDHGNREHQVALRAAYGAKAFTCPGKCGTCTPTGHACGSERFRGVPIIIAAH